MFYGSFFAHVGDIYGSGSAVAETNAQSAVDEPILTIIIGVLFALTIVGLVASLAAELRGKAPATD
jgi:hypothetical protein